jgi:hypothetical protein
MLNNDIYYHTALLKTKRKYILNKMYPQYIIYFIYAILLIGLYEINTSTFTNKLVKLSESQSYLRRGLTNIDSFNDSNYRLNMDDNKDIIVFSDDELRVFNNPPSVNKILGMVDMMKKTFFPNLKSSNNVIDDDLQYDDYLFDDELLGEIKLD